MEINKSIIGLFSEIFILLGLILVTSFIWKELDQSNYAKIAYTYANNDKLSLNIENNKIIINNKNNNNKEYNLYLKINNNEKNIDLIINNETININMLDSFTKGSTTYYLIDNNKIDSKSTEQYIVYLNANVNHSFNLEEV